MATTSLRPRFLRCSGPRPRRGSDVEDAPAGEPHRPSLTGGPATERREVRVRPEQACHDQAVVALDDLEHLAARLECVEQHLPVGVSKRHCGAGSVGRRDQSSVSERRSCLRYVERSTPSRT